MKTKQVLVFIIVCSLIGAIFELPENKVAGTWFLMITILGMYGAYVERSKTKKEPREKHEEN